MKKWQIVDEVGFVKNEVSLQQITFSFHHLLHKPFPTSGSGRDLPATLSTAMAIVNNKNIFGCTFTYSEFLLQTNSLSCHSEFTEPLF